MTKRKFIGLGRKRKASLSSESEAELQKKQPYELPNNFILGLTNQHPDKFQQKPEKKVNSEE
ncbi:MAG TPA: hypothetical protein VFM69_06255 [Pricia sp.]|nr:hypothetical protein [Pricia sp.]